MAKENSPKSLEGDVSPSSRHPKMSKDYEVEVNERRVEDEPPNTTTPVSPPSPQVGGDSGPYNRSGQFEATEEEDAAVHGDAPAGALKKDRPNWQDEGRAAPAATDSAQKESDPEEPSAP